MRQYGSRAHGPGEDGRAGTRAGRRAERAGREGVPARPSSLASGPGARIASLNFAIAIASQIEGNSGTLVKIENLRKSFTLQNFVENRSHF